MLKISKHVSQIDLKCQQDGTPQDALELYGEMDLDPTNTESHLKTVLDTSFLEGISPLAAAKNLPKYQSNPFGNIDVGVNMTCVAVAPTQSGKTAIEAFLAIKAALTNNVVTVVVTQNKTSELARMARGFETSSDIFADCCDAVGSKRSPALKTIYPSGSSNRLDEFERGFRRWKSGKSSDIPMYILLMNASKMDTLRMIVAIVGDDPLRDEKGRLPIQLLFDEGDLSFKSSDKSTSFEKALHSGTGEIELETLFDCISAVTYVTASILALLLSDLSAGGRDVMSVQIRPSPNYHGYAEVVQYSPDCATIERKEGTRGEYLEFVMESPEPHAGTVYTSSAAGVNQRVDRAHRTAVDNKGVRGLVAISWSSEKLDVFTSDRLWQSVLDRAPIPFDKTVDKDDIAHYKGTKSNNAINDYPSCITFMLRQARKQVNSDGFIKSILFAKEMVDRGVSVCGLNHEHHLDSLFVDMPEAHGEVIQQLCGRLTGIEKTRVLKVLFGSAQMHKEHKRALITNLFCAKQIAKHSSSLYDILADLRKKVDAADFGEEVCDASGLYLMLKADLTRPSVERKLRRERGLVTASAKRRKVSVVDVDVDAAVEANSVWSSMYHSEEVPKTDNEPPQPSTIAKSEPAPEISGEPQIKPEPVEKRGMHEFFNNHSAVLVSIFKEVIDSHKKGLGIAEFSVAVAGSDNYPSTDLTAEAVVNHAVEHRGDVLGGADLFCYEGKIMSHEFV